MMQTAELRIGRSADGAIATRVWRELGQLALECMAIGLVSSMLLAAAVYMVARNAHGDADYATNAAPVAVAAARTSAPTSGG